MEDLKHLMRDNYLRYASYVILDRAIPNVADGLKPVQRRILHTLRMIHDGKLHKVANVAGQTMAFHPHGDAPIVDALVNLANKDYLLDRQGNFGNLFTGDPAAAARYIETRLSPLAIEAMFNPDLTESVPSYDGRNLEPVELPAKIPLLLIQGAEGIAVGMSTRVLPHNFVELLEAEIAILEGKEYEIFPDFPTGGIMDASGYAKGKGKVKLRAKIDIVDEKSLVIRDICYGTTTESVIRSIDDAAKKGKIKIDTINDYSTDKVEIEIKLPRGQYASKIIEALYAFTDCEVSLNSQIVVIRDNLPWETTVDEVLEDHTERLKGYLRRELEIERDRLLEKIYQKTLEQIFIENRLYKKIEEKKSYDAVHDTIAKSLKPYHKQLSRIPTEEDRERLLSIPIRRISRFDIDKNQEEIAIMEERVDQIEKELRNIKRVTIRYLKHLIKKYGDDHPRMTQVDEIVEIDKRKVAMQKLTVGFDVKKGFIGTKVSSETVIECTNFDKLLLMFKDGSYRVTNIPEKEYIHSPSNPVIYAGIADKTTIMNVVYRNPKTHHCYGKRFIVSKFILDKEYRFMEEDMKLEMFSTEPEVMVKLHFKPKPKQKLSTQVYNLSELLVKGVSAKGIRLSPKEVKQVKLCKTKPKPEPDLFEATKG